MLRPVLNKTWKPHPIKQLLYCNLSSIFKTIQISRTRHAQLAGETRINVLLWIPSHRRTSVGRPTKTYLQELCTDKGCSLGDQPRAMDDRDELRESAKEIRASRTTS